MALRRPARDDLRSAPPALHERALAEGKVAPDANLLPRTRRELRKLFYHARPSLKLASRLYVILWRAKQFINRGIRGR